MFAAILLLAQDHGVAGDRCDQGYRSTMRTARPTTGSALSVSEVRTAPFNPACSSFQLFCGLDPANPFIAREGCNVPPRRQRFRVGGQRHFQIRGQGVDHTAWNLLYAESFAHAVFR